ncbi:MAG TPA: RpiB/LacA/LacB family sugar-phosphate isomerase [Pirellulales bacterium]|nr:RpiB/LacA/LacB family sugar-phosphate isomerase [Pirellulales bacterium]
MRIAIGSDHRGFAVKQKLIELLKQLGQEAVDVGTNGTESCDYPDSNRSRPGVAGAKTALRA